MVNVAMERKSQIDEGVKIAQKIDILRTDLTTLQTQHDKFVTGMDSELRSRIQPLIAQENSLKREITVLEDKKAKLLIPPNEMWKEINQRMTDDDLFKAILQGKESKLAERERIQDKRDQKSKDITAKANARDRESVKAYNEALDSRATAESLRQIVLQQKDIQEKMFDDREKEIAGRESSIEAYEFSLKMRDEQADIREEEIKNKEIQLADRQATLERAMARLIK